MKRLLAAVALLTSLFASGVQAQTTTTYYGLIKDLAGNPVTSGKITFTLRPSTDVTESGLARFTTQTITCPIASTGNVVGLANSNVTATTGTTSPGTSVTVASATGFANGQPLVIAGAGAAGAVYVGAITNVVSNTFTVSPATLTSVAAGAAVYTGCQVTMNTALQPQNSGYLLKFWPGNVNTATIFTYALNAATDISTVVSTQAQLPSVGGFLDLFSNQTIGGNKTFTGATSAKTLQNVRYVSPTNIEGWGGANAAAWANAAAADLGGAGAVIFRSGIYSIPTGNPILLSADGLTYACAVYRGCFLNGSSFVAGDFFFLMAVNHASTSVSGFVMQCSPSPPAIDIRGITVNNGITSSRGLFENNEIYNCFDGIDLIANSVDNVIQKNYIHNVNQQGITVQGNTNQLLNNRIDSVGTTNLHHGIYVQAGAGNLVQGNQVSNAQGFCIQAFVLSAAGSLTADRIIANNCVNGGLAGSGTRGGIAVAETPPATGTRQVIVQGNTIASTNGNPLYISAATDTLLADNTVITYQGDCITIQGSSGFAAGKINAHDNTCTGGTVSGNGMRLNLNGGSSLSRVDAHDNTFDTLFGVCIWAQGLTDSLIHNNHCKDYNSQGVFSNACVRLESSTLRTIVSQNNCSTLNTTGAPNGVYVVDATNTDNEVTGNILLGIGAGGPVGDAGLRTQIYGNHTQTGTGQVENPSGIMPSAIGPGPNNRCQVDGGAVNGGSHPTIASCMGLQGGVSGLRSLNTFSNIPEDITTNPATTNQAFELHLGTATVKSSICDTTNKNCWISEVPMIMSPGSSIWGEGPIVTSNPEFSSGTAWVTGNNWFPPLGVPTITTPTCSATGTGALSNGTYFLWVRTANNLQTNGGPAVAGPSMHTAEFAVVCAGGTATQAINIPIPSAVGNSPFQAQDFQIAASTTSGTELEQATNTAGSPTPLSCTAGVVSTFNGVNYGCKMSGGTAATLNGPLQTGTRSFQDTDLSNVAFVFGAAQTVSFTYMMTGLSVNCGPIGSGAVYNPPNWLVWNQSGEELKGLNPFGLSLDGPCGGYSGGAASSPGGGTPTTGGSANPFSGGLVYEDTKTPNGISEHIKTGGNGPNCGSTCAGTALTLSQASAASGVATTYTGTITGGAANALANTWVGIKGFTNSPNNGEVFYVLSSTATTLVVINPSGVAETHAGTATEATPFYPFYFDGRADGTGGAAGVPRIVNDITSAPKNAGSYIPAVFYVTGLRSRIHFTNIHIETNQPVTSDGIQCDNGAYCLLDGVEGQNATVGILAHLTASGAFMGGYGLCPIGTAGSFQDRCKGLGQSGTAATFKDDTPGGQKLLAFVGPFSSVVANFKFVGLAPMPFATLNAIYPCAAGTEGYEGSVTDDLAAIAFNATITGGGTNHVHAYCNGTNWVMQ